MLRWFIPVITGALLCLCSASASADRIQKLANKLATGRTDKVRISAALSLAKSKDDRAIAALTRSLSKDKSPAIRRISAASLGQRLRDRLGAKAKKQALHALKKAALRDRDSNVRSSAKVALAKANLKSSPRSSARRTKGILVHVMPPKKLSKRLPKNTASMMQATVKNVINSKAPKYVKTAPGTGMPSSSQLARTSTAGFSVHPNLSKLKLLRSGRRITVQCEVKMQVQPWAIKGQNLAVDRTATVTGSGSVTSSNSKRAIASSSQACIQAVVTQVTSNQIVPFLVAKAR